MVDFITSDQLNITGRSQVPCQGSWSEGERSQGGAQRFLQISKDPAHGHLDLVLLRKLVVVFLLLKIKNKILIIRDSIVFMRQVMSRVMTVRKWSQKSFSGSYVPNPNLVFLNIICQIVFNFFNLLIHVRRLPCSMLMIT